MLEEGRYEDGIAFIRALEGSSSPEGDISAPSAEVQQAVISPAAQDTQAKRALSTADAEALKTRLPSDSELESLLKGTPAEMRTAISTVADASALLDLLFPELWMDAVAIDPQTSEGWYQNPVDVIELCQNGSLSVVGRSDMVNAAAYLLEDDYTMGMLFAVLIDESENIVPTAAANYFRTESGYILVDPVLGMGGTPEATTWI